MEIERKSAVKRGFIYKWHEGLQDERFVLVMSTNDRGNERFISILMLGNSGAGRDTVKVSNQSLGEDCYVHCGMLTYVNRADMTEKPLTQVSDSTMAKIDRQLCIQLGITNEDTLAELRFYQRKCNELLEKCTGVNFDL